MITSEPVVNKGKGTSSGRKIGKLAQLMNMPLDVFFEACPMFASSGRFSRLICTIADYRTS